MALSEATSAARVSGVKATDITLISGTDRLALFVVPPDVRLGTATSGTYGSDPTTLAVESENFVFLAARSA
eukprot:5385640-Amphidinium_carterae.1